MKEIEVSHGPRVLFTGLDYEQNQFTRQLKALGCDVSWVNGDKSSAFPLFCEAAVIAKAHCSHQRFWDVKEKYGSMDKPVFIADHSFSTIRERVEHFVNEWKISNPPKTVMAKALAPLFPKEESVMQSQEQTKKIYINGKATGGQKFPHGERAERYSREDSNLIVKTIYEATCAEFQEKDIAEMISATGVKKNGGTAWTRSDVSNWRRRAKYLSFLEGQKSQAHHAPPPATTPHQARPQPQSNEARIFKAILDAGLTDAQKVAVMQKIASGQVSGDEALAFIKVLGE